MTLPCEYCGAPVRADEFVKLAVWPCCRDCQWIPALGFCVGILFFFGVVYVVWRSLHG